MSATDYYKLLRHVDDRTRTVHVAPFDGGQPDSSVDAFNACDVQAKTGDRIVQWQGGALATVARCQE